MSANARDWLEERVRDGMVRQLRQNLARCRRVILDERMDLKTRERWTQLYNNTSQGLNQILKDMQMRDWEKRLREIEEYENIPEGVERSQAAPTEPKDRRPRRTITPQGPLKAIRILESRPIEKRRTRPSRIFLNATAYTVDLELFRFRKDREKKRDDFKDTNPRNCQ